MNEPAPQTSPAAPRALAHPPAEPCEAALPAGKGPVWPGGDRAAPDCGALQNGNLGSSHLNGWKKISHSLVSAQTHGSPREANL